jgi:hypothetical protein
MSKIAQNAGRNTMQFQKILITSLLMLLCLISEAIGQEKHNVKLACGDNVVEIVCGRDKTPENEDARKCNMNKLIFTNKKGKVMVPSTPKGFDISKTASSLSCGRSKKGQYFVLVEFSNGPYDCAPCTVYDLFESSGNRVTINSKKLDSTVERLGVIFSRQVKIEENN